ncbi:HNH endonuclease, partial [Pseudomonas aeruginosa]
MNPLQRALIEKTGHDNGFEHVLSSAGDAVILASARHRSQAVVTASADGFGLRLQPATPALLPELLRSFQPRAGADDVFCVLTLPDLAALLRRTASLSQALPNQEGGSVRPLLTSAGVNAGKLRTDIEQALSRLPQVEGTGGD